MGDPFELTHAGQTAKVAALARLAGGMAHDFNNALMVIFGNAELGLLAAEADSPARPALEQIFAAAGRAADYCKQMMAYAGGLRLALRPTDVAAVLGDLEDSLIASLPNQTAVVLRTELADRLPAIDAEPIELRRLVELLVANAADALPVEGGSITLRLTAAALAPHELAGFLPAANLPAGSYVVLEIADTGSGMDPDTAARAFDPFFTTKGKGRGLGLAIALGIVRGHHGAIGLDSQPGQGTRVRVLLPASSSVAPGDGSRSLESLTWRGHGPALIVDSNEAARTVAGALLEHFGFDALLADDVSQALEMLSGMADAPQVIVLAVVGSVADAERAIEQLRECAPSARILVSSASQAGGRFDPALIAGADGFLAGPLSAENLGAQLRSVFG